jgi:hypothetical protein
MLFLLNVLPVSVRESSLEPSADGQRRRETRADVVNHKVRGLRGSGIRSYWASTSSQPQALSGYRRPTDFASISLKWM